jgi:2-dehydropantoate 2-reductase
MLSFGVAFVTDEVLIWGAGAVGGTLGAYLQRAGRRSILVDRDLDHVAAMKRSGLAIEGPVDEFSVPVTAAAPDEVRGTYKTVFLAVKAQHTGEAALALRPHVAPEGHVVSWQNGLNELTLIEILGPERVIGAFINYGADYLAPGRILFGGRAAVVVGELDGRDTERLRRLHALLRIFEPDAVSTDNIWGYLWGKLGYGALLFATALTNESIADALASSRHRRTLAGLAAEIVGLAVKRGVRPLGFNGYDPEAFKPGGDPAAVERSFAAMVDHNRKSAKTHSGIWRDLAVRKRKTEIDAQIAVMLPLAEEVGHPMPVTRRLVELIHDVEDGRRPQAWETLDALVTSLR